MNEGHTKGRICIDEKGHMEGESAAKRKGYMEGRICSEEGGDIWKGRSASVSPGRAGTNIYEYTGRMSVGCGSPYGGLDGRAGARYCILGPSVRSILPSRHLVLRGGCGSMRTPYSALRTYSAYMED